MTLEEYNLLEQDFSASDTDVKTFLKEKGVSINTYYYWRRRSKELKEERLHQEGQFLPIDLHSGELIKPTKCVKSIKATFNLTGGDRD